MTIMSYLQCFAIAVALVCVASVLSLGVSVCTGNSRYLRTTVALGKIIFGMITAALVLFSLLSVLLNGTLL